MVKLMMLWTPEPSSISIGTFAIRSPLLFQDYLTYRMIEAQFGLADDYFLVNFDNGDIYLRRELRLNPNVNRYVVRKFNINHP